MTSTTDELRRLLNERSVKWVACDKAPDLTLKDFHDTRWDANGVRWSYMEINGKSTLSPVGRVEIELTPKQAVAATLGSDNRATEPTSDISERFDKKSKKDSEVGITYLWPSKKFPSFIRLEGRRGEYEVYKPERTCEFVGDIEHPPKCSVCGWQPDIYDYEWMEDDEYEYNGNFCKECGALVRKVVDVDERDHEEYEEIMAKYVEKIRLGLVL